MIFEWSSAPSFLFAPRAGAGRSCVSLHSPELGLGAAAVTLEHEAIDDASRIFEGAGSVDGVALYAVRTHRECCTSTGGTR
jgi:hypothetical protein